MFAYPCPACSHTLLAPADRAGHKTACPNCLTRLTVPHPDGEPTGVFGSAPCCVEPPPPAATDAPPDTVLNPERVRLSPAGPG